MHDFLIHSKKFTPYFYRSPYKRNVVYSNIAPPSTTKWMPNMWATAYVWNILE